jgi:hypothetical protein
MTHLTHAKKIAHPAKECLTACRPRAMFNHQQRETTMTNTEMNKRLATIPLNTLCRVIQCIKIGRAHV